MRVQIPTVKPNWLTEQWAESSRDPGYCGRTCTGDSSVGGARQVIHPVGIPRPMDERALMMSPQKAKLGEFSSIHSSSTAHHIFIQYLLTQEHLGRSQLAPFKESHGKIDPQILI